jgi:hypothetical protein
VVYGLQGATTSIPHLLHLSLLSNNSPGIQSSSTQIATGTPFRFLVLSANLFFEDSCL